MELPAALLRALPAPPRTGPDPRLLAFTRPRSYNEFALGGGISECGDTPARTREEAGRFSWLVSPARPGLRQGRPYGAQHQKGSRCPGEPMPPARSPPPPTPHPPGRHHHV
jgi:hypothetical protein